MIQNIVLALLVVSLIGIPDYCESQKYDASDVIDKSPEEIVEMRGYTPETHFVRTPDGYHIHVVRMINPLIKSKKLKRPVIFNHGLLESSTIWLINSNKVKPINNRCTNLDDQMLINNHTSFINGPMMLANHGYDVWLMSMRGTDWSQSHDHLTAQDEKFWDYCLDDFALSDVPSVIDYVRHKTKSPKVGYIGHSQATFSIFGLLSIEPHYADVIEPVIAIAPVAYMEHITSMARVLFLGALRGTNTDQNGPFPRNAPRMRTMFSDVCDPESIRMFSKHACQMFETLISGRGEKWLKGFYNHLPFYTSWKVLRHFGQLVDQKRHMMYDYEEEVNMKLYGVEQSPSYPVANIKSKSMCLFSTKSDTLSPPRDVANFISNLRVPLFKNIFINKDFNHFDLITDVQAGELVFFPTLKIFEFFEAASGGVCSLKTNNKSKSIKGQN